MPLIVTTSVTDPPADRITSTDGLISAVADTDRTGVLLRADMSSTWGSSDTFEQNTNGWSAVTSATVARSTTNPASGTASLLWTRTSPTSIISRSVPQLAAKPYDRVIMVSLKARTSTDPVPLSVALLDSDTGSVEMGTPNSTTGFYFATLVLGAGVTPGTSLNFVADGSDIPNTSTLTLDDVTIELQPPVHVWFYRDGEQMRGASPAKAADGIAYAYDYEASPGKATTWSCQPEYVVNGDYVLGEESAQIALITHDLAADYNMSIKSLADPDLSRKVIGKWPAATRSWEGRDTMSANPGASLSSGSWDVPVQQAETWVMETVTHEEAVDLENLLTSGPLLVQHQAVRRRPDTYALVKSIACDYKTGPNFPQRLWTVAFLPIEQPTSVGAPLLIPGRSYSDLAGIGTYADVAGTLASYDDFLTPVTTQVGPGFGLAAFGVGAFGT